MWSEVAYLSALYGGAWSVYVIFVKFTPLSRNLFGALAPRCLVLYFHWIVIWFECRCPVQVPGLIISDHASFTGTWQPIRLVRPPSCSLSWLHVVDRTQPCVAISCRGGRRAASSFIVSAAGDLGPRAPRRQSVTATPRWG